MGGQDGNPRSEKNGISRKEGIAMKSFLAGLSVVVACGFFSAPIAADAQGCKDHPLFNRMPNYEIYSCMELGEKLKTISFTAFPRKAFQRE